MTNPMCKEQQSFYNNDKFTRIFGMGYTERCKGFAIKNYLEEEVE